MHAAFTAFTVLGILTLLSLPLGWLAGVAVRHVRIAASRKLWRRHATIIAMYTPPEGLRPAEAAFLYDRVFGNEELLATLFDLEQRGKVTLLPHANPAGADFTIQAHASGNEKGLRPFERELLYTLHARKHLTWRNLAADSAIWDESIERALEDSLHTRGYFWFAEEHKGRRVFLLLGVTLASLAIAMPVLLGETLLKPSGNGFAELDRELSLGLLALIWAACSAAYALGLYYAYSAFCRGMDMERGTWQLARLWPHLEGFREYLIVVEQARVQFANETLKTTVVHEALPYAIALNVTTKWEARFTARKP